MENTDDLILKYYIYTYIDNTTNVYRGLISYEADLESKINNGWILNGEFYAINPSLKPIPKNTKIFSLKIKDYYPYDISDYKMLYDIFEVNDKLKDIFYVNFITYNRPILNSTPLYFYELNNSIFPSFDKNPPNSNYSLAIGINPIFVLKNKNTKFYCDNGKCLPGPMSSNHFHPNMQYDDTLSYSNCLNKCKDETYKFLNVIEKISYENSKKSNYIINKLFSLKIIILIITIVVIIIFISYFNFNKNIKF